MGLNMERYDNITTDIIFNRGYNQFEPFKRSDTVEGVFMYEDDIIYSFYINGDKMHWSL